MYKHPMLSVKEAAAMLGCDERWIRERLNQGQLKGEKKTIGMKEKWFVYKGEIDAALARKGVTPTVAVPQTDFEPSVTDAVINSEPYEESSEEEPTPAREWLGMERDAVRLLAEEMVKPLVETIKQQTLALSERDRMIEDQGRQLRLLPDLEKREETARKEAEMKALELEALNKQIAALQEEKETLAEKAREANELTQDIDSLKAQVEQLQKPWWKKMFGAQQ